MNEKKGSCRSNIRNESSLIFKLVFSSLNTILFPKVPKKPESQAGENHQHARDEISRRGKSVMRFHESLPEILNSHDGMRPWSSLKTANIFPIQSEYFLKPCTEESTMLCYEYPCGHPASVIHHITTQAPFLAHSLPEDLDFFDFFPSERGGRAFQF